MARGEMSQSGPLSDLRVVDFGWVLAAPYATRLLADYGAEVIKIQPLFGFDTDDVFSRGYFNTWNRNKLGITLNMTSPEGKELARKLIAVSDVVVENFAPRVMENWEMDWDHLCQFKPGIIFLRMSAAGHSGPWRNYNGFGPTVHAWSGLTYLTGYPDRELCGPGFSYADHVAGLYGVIAVLEALEHRRCTGLGRCIDLSELEAAASVLGPAIMEFSLTGREPQPECNRSRQAAPHGVYPCLGEDRWCAIAVFTDEEWLALCQVIEQPDLAGRFSTLEDRQKNQDEVDRLVSQWTTLHAAEEAMELMQNAGVAAGVVQDASDLARDPQLQSRGFFVKLEHPHLGKTTADGTPVRLSETPATFRQAAPILGQDNDYVFRELLHLSDEEMERLQNDGVI